MDEALLNNSDTEGVFSGFTFIAQEEEDSFIKTCVKFIGFS